MILRILHYHLILLAWHKSTICTLHRVVWCTRILRDWSFSSHIFLKQIEKFLICFIHKSERKIFWIQLSSRLTLALGIIWTICDKTSIVIVHESLLLRWWIMQHYWSCTCICCSRFFWRKILYCWFFKLENYFFLLCNIHLWLKCL